MQNSRVTQTATVKTEDSSLLSKLSNLFVGLIVFFASTQFGFHFWPSSALVYGIRVDFLSPTIYFLDTLIVLFLAVKGSDLKGRAQPADAKAGRSDPIGAVVSILLVNLLYSQNPLATISWSLHFLLYLLFLRTVLKRNSWLQAKLGSAAAERTVLNGILSLTLTLSLLFQAILASIQVFLGHSLGGLMYYLGERTVAVGAPGIALGSFMGHVVLRAYGTFGHPNVLAGYTIISLLIILRLAPKFRSSGGLQRSARQIGTLTIALIILSLTQSRAATLSLFGIIIPFYLLKNLKLRFLYYFIALLLYYSLAPSLLSPPRADLSLTERLDLQGLSLRSIRHFPVFGTGAQASISTYPQVDSSVRLLQPDHNSFTLFLSWFGVFGILATIYYLKYCLKFGAWNLIILAPVLPLLFLDHYLLTSPQGLFISIFYLAEISSTTNVCKISR